MFTRLVVLCLMSVINLIQSPYAFADANENGQLSLICKYTSCTKHIRYVAPSGHVEQDEEKTCPLGTSFELSFPAKSEKTTMTSKDGVDLTITTTDASYKFFAQLPPESSGDTTGTHTYSVNIDRYTGMIVRDENRSVSSGDHPTLIQSTFHSEGTCSKKSDTHKQF